MSVVTAVPELASNERVTFSEIRRSEDVKLSNFTRFGNDVRVMKTVVGNQWR